MFKRKEKEARLLILESRVSGVSNELKEVLDQLTSADAFSEKVECDVCGCLLKKETAIKGTPTIEKRRIAPLFGVVAPFCALIKEVIVEHCYCKVHAPKKKGAKK